MLAVVVIPEREMNWHLLFAQRLQEACERGVIFLLAAVVSAIAVNENPGGPEGQCHYFIHHLCQVVSHIDVLVDLRAVGSDVRIGK